jgi:hypothetical protein
MENHIQTVLFGMEVDQKLHQNHQSKKVQQIEMNLFGKTLSKLSTQVPTRHLFYKYLKK